MAEVLITLGIIGIVAAMTLPSLINNSRNKALEAGLKKNYSVIMQALTMYQAQNGMALTSSDVGPRELKSLIMPYFKVLKDCGNGTEDTACIYYDSSGNYEDKTYMTYNNNKLALSNFDDGQFILEDGSLILLQNSTSTDDTRRYISVDVNGFLKNPNRLGHDLFMFQLDEKGKLLPMGAEGTNYYSKNDYYCSATSTHNMNGAGCTYKALTDKNYFKNLPR